MEIPFNTQSIELFTVFVLPGFVSLSVYRLLMPAHRIGWGDALVQGLFYSVVNFVLLLPVIYIALAEGTAPIWAWLSAILFLLVTPALWPVCLRLAFRWKWLIQKIQVPYPTAWDYFFDLRDPVFVLIHLNNGSLLGGYWGGDSYAGSFPNDGDIYLQAVYRLNENGEFGEPVSDTKGVLLRKDQYTYVELFSVPEQAE